jgi:exopolyphosphatase / guanosine-5'-triphosphate,3'-diphosphate pyrophosphatase
MSNSTRASIDLGTNTCLLLVAECRAQQVIQVHYDRSQVVRLGQGVDQSRKLQPEPMKRVLACLKDYAARVKTFGVQPEDAKCVATSQARDAENSREFFDLIQKETGFRFQVLSGEREARLTFLGSAGAVKEDAVVIDIGGGSTELISLNQELSLDLGSVRFTERFFKANSSRPVTDEEFWDCQDAIDEEVQKWKPFRQNLSKEVQLIAVAGTATTLAAWHLSLKTFDVAKVDGTVLSRGDVHRCVEELKWRTVAERTQLPAMEPLRADVILAGALILWRVMELLNFSECRVSTRGLRYGVLLEE